jgi:DNA mismatch endonuclease (patch repair protein)
LTRGVPRLVPNSPSLARSRNMRAIASRGNRSTDLAMVSLLRKHRELSGWRRHAELPGTPDFVWRSKKVALIIDGCFWHGCESCYVAPRTNRGCWTEKVDQNRRRDRRVARALRSLGWHVLRVRECRVNLPGTIKRLQRAFAGHTDSRSYRTSAR